MFKLLFAAIVGANVIALAAAAKPSYRGRNGYESSSRSLKKNGKKNAGAKTSSAQCAGTKPTGKVLVVHQECPGKCLSVDANKLRYTTCDHCNAVWEIIHVSNDLFKLKNTHPSGWCIPAPSDCTETSVDPSNRVNRLVKCDDTDINGKAATFGRLDEDDPNSVLDFGCWVGGDATRLVSDNSPDVCNTNAANGMNVYWDATSPPLADSDTRLSGWNIVDISDDYDHGPGCVMNLPIV